MMNNNNSYQLFVKSFLLLLLCIAMPIKNSIAQNNNINYSVDLSTDKSFYVVGEIIGIKTIIPEFLIYKNSKHDYIYCDLISQEGNIKSSIKLMLTNGMGKGQIFIPNNLKSGYYILRAYTRQMRTTPSSYAFLEIKIVNINDANTCTIGSNQRIKLDIDSVINTPEIEIKGLLKKYTKREKVSFSFVLDTLLYSSSSVSISVIPKQAFASNKLKAELIADISVDSNLAFYENRGFTFIGKLSHTDSGNTDGGKRIFVNIMNTKNTQAIITDSNGYFYLSMPNIYNEQEVYISTDTVDKDARVLVIKDYDTYSNYLLNKELRLTNEQKNFALLLSQNIALRKSFTKNVKPTIVAEKKEAIPFYYEPDQVTVIMDYVDMPTLRMYFEEIPNGAQLYKQKGKTKARIYDKNEIPLVLEPIIMIDYVVVNVLDAVLELSPKSINRIEVVKQYYQLGDVSFGGIVNIITNNSDFGGFNFANSSAVINYNFLNEYLPFDNGFSTENNDLDTRTTLCWNPNPMIYDGKFEIKFRTSDVINNYNVVIQGLDNQGKPFCFTRDFEVE